MNTKAIRVIGLAVIFLLLTSAVVPELKRIERQKSDHIEQIFGYDYQIDKTKRNIENLRMEIIITLKEVEMQQR